MIAQSSCKRPPQPAYINAVTVKRTVDTLYCVTVYSSSIHHTNWPTETEQNSTGACFIITDTALHTSRMTTAQCQLPHVFDTESVPLDVLQILNRLHK